MSRIFPTFIYQNVTEAKSKGEFIMHLLPPAALIQVVRTGGTFTLKLINCYEATATAESIKMVMDRAKQWYIHACNPMPEINIPVNGVTIQTAYNHLIATRGIYKKLNLDRSTVAIIRSKIVEKRKYPSYESMVEHLTKTGWYRVQDELWNKPQ